ncbi:hypothetical protein FBUS_05189 [Fasciolopsis buskii]|uniref:Uncharacterized protein n=1 Tax=Fasciolopsis buskii TaxID=27845 RepID=A0A8E0VNJ7_9TREM|nr:hypothetical protein FBUS_05189 [Fasciolopsis buski]
MKPHEEELKLLAQIAEMKENLNLRQRKSKGLNFEKMVSEANLPSYPHLPLLTPVYQLRAHTSKVHDVVWTPTDKYVLTVGGEGCIVIWEAQSGLIYNVVDVASIQPLTAAATGNGERLFCGGLCANVVLYTNKHQSPEDGYSIYENNLVYEHSGQVSNIICIDDEQLLTAAASDGALLWDVEKVKVINRFEHPYSVVQCLCLSPGDKQLFLTGCEDGTIRLWDTRMSGKPTALFEAHHSDVNCVEFLPTGNNFVSGSEDTMMHLYDLRTDVTLARYIHQFLTPQSNVLDADLPAPPQTDEPEQSDSAAVCDLAVSSSGRLVISGCRNSTVYFWDLTQPTECLYQEYEIGPVVKLAMSNQKTALAMMTWDAKSRIRLMRPR